MTSLSLILYRNLPSVQSSAMLSVTTQMQFKVKTLLQILNITYTFPIFKLSVSIKSMCKFTHHGVSGKYGDFYKQPCLVTSFLLI